MARSLDVNTKEIILASVEELISKDGANSISLRDIASKADISLGTLYYYYKTKDELILDLGSIYFDNLSKEYFDWLNRHKLDLTPERFFEVIFHKGSKIFNIGKIQLFLLNESIGGNKDLQERFKKVYKNWKENMKVGIKQVFPDIKDIDTYSSILMMLVDGMIFQNLLNIDTDINKVSKELLKGVIK